MDARELAKKYIHHRNLLVRGQLELSVVMSLFNTGMLFGLFLKNVLNIPTSYVVYIISGCVTLTAFLQYLFGWYYERKKLFDEENNWMTDRTPLFQKLINQNVNRKGEYGYYHTENLEGRDEFGTGRCSINRTMSFNYQLDDKSRRCDKGRV